MRCHWCGDVLDDRAVAFELAPDPVAGRELDKLAAREWPLARVLEELAGDYEHCLLD